jgi:hypothetical protein
MPPDNMCPRFQVGSESNFKRGYDALVQSVSGNWESKRFVCLSLRSGARSPVLEQIRKRSIQKLDSKRGKGLVSLGHSNAEY